MPKLNEEISQAATTARGRPKGRRPSLKFSVWSPRHQQLFGDGYHDGQNERRRQRLP